MKKKDPTSHRIIEKRRRDRMNKCLADLSKLIPNHYMKRSRGRVEKTEIIEMAIKHLKDLTKASGGPGGGRDKHASHGHEQRRFERCHHPECPSSSGRTMAREQLEQERAPLDMARAQKVLADGAQQTVRMDWQLGGCASGTASQVSGNDKADLGGGLYMPLTCTLGGGSGARTSHASAEQSGGATSISRTQQTSPQRAAASPSSPTCSSPSSGSPSSSASSSDSSSRCQSLSTRAFHAQQYQNNERHINNRMSEQAAAGANNNKYHRASMANSSSSGSDTSSGGGGGGATGCGNGCANSHAGISSSSSCSCRISGGANCLLRNGSSCALLAGSSSDDNVKYEAELASASGSGSSSFSSSGAGTASDGGPLSASNKTGQIECCSCKARAGLKGSQQQQQQQLFQQHNNNITNSNSNINCININGHKHVKHMTADCGAEQIDTCSAARRLTLPGANSSSEHSDDAGSMDLSSGSGRSHNESLAPRTTFRTVVAVIATNCHHASRPHRNTTPARLAPAGHVASTCDSSSPGSQQQQQQRPLDTSSAQSSPACSPLASSSSPTSPGSSATSAAPGWCKKAWLIRSFARSLPQSHQL